ncbi:MAG TPA: hypothetical protein VFM93_01270 [Candidatus Limnocylindria bacterium]|nr:hypothetical protein [Candidatus Limnocylindria bacterium]
MRNALLGPAYGLILPAVASLHARHIGLRASGAVLATIFGTAHAAMSILGTVNVDAQGPAVFLMGVWWWTCGKMWFETATLPRALDLATTALAPVVMLASFAVAVNAPLLAFGAPDLRVWEVTRVALAVWLVALAAMLWRSSYEVAPPPR